MVYVNSTYSKPPGLPLSNFETKRLAKYSTKYSTYPISDGSTMAPGAMKKFDHFLADLKYIAPDDSHVSIENFIGYTSVPLGLAGPLRVHGLDGAPEDAYAPMATTEAAIIASCCRGCKALNSSGGIHFSSLGQVMSRSPVFQFDSPREAIQFSRRLPEFKDALARSAEATSRHARLQDLTSYITGSDVYVRFSFTRGDAAGQNMVTIATQHACDWLRTTFAPELKIRNFLIEGNMAPDKKPSWGAVVAPRGVEVVSWAVLSDAACQKVLGCTAERLYKTHRLFQEGGIRNGQFGSNVNTANVVTAIFIATGQDVASVAEGAWAHFICDYDYTSKSLKISLYMPSLAVGTVGGGTGYATQQEALRIMNCTGPNSKSRLAGLISAFAIALEISTIAAGASDTFSASHQKLARKNKI